VADWVSYLRVSTDKQGESGLGLEAQREAVARHLGASAPLAEFVEVESGKRAANRPKLIAALELCKRRKAKLVIAKLDRMSRNVHFISGLLESGVEFIACDNPHANKMTIQLLAVFAEHEREQISTRTKDALAAVNRELAEKGQRISKQGRVFTRLGNPRWQECLPKARLVKDPNPPAPAVVAMMQRLRSEGRTLRAIADELNGLGLRTPKENRWYASTVSNVIRHADSEWCADSRMVA
jgi:DNA invertase Pin-like site-specific DNA recombinase